MRFNPGRQENEAYRKSSVKLFNSITLNAMSSVQVAVHLERFIALSSVGVLRKDLPKLLGRRPVQSALELFPVAIDRISKRVSLVLDPLRTVELLECILKSEFNRLKHFWQLAKRFEAALIKGDYSLASSTLDDVESIFGASLWVIRSRTILLASQGSLTELNDYSDMAKREIKDGFAYFMVNVYLLLATDPLLHSKQIISSTIRELQEAGLREWADLLKLMFSPSPNMRPGESLSCVELIKNYPVIDQLCLLVPYLANESCHRALTAREASLHCVVKEITSSEPQSTDVVVAYEKGEYGKAIQEYFQADERDLILLSCLAAKAMKIADWEEELPWTGALRDLLHALMSIYAMDKPPQQCRATLDAALLQMHYLPSGALLQLLQYQALPAQFSGEERSLAARQLVSREGLKSAWMELLCSEGDPNIGNRYGVASTSLPTHRVLKETIRKEYSAGADENLLASLLADYEHIAPLRRDYLELASSIRVGLGALAPLLAVCAESIAANEDAYGAFPLSALADYVESSSSCDIDALVVLYSYVRNVDSTRDYVLNEFYEEYLRMNGVSRPSELRLEERGREKLLLLLRDVSVPEMLDFLSVFKSSSEVRAERLKILDILLKERAIDADRHRAEVDETLLQAVIDNGAAQFNAHKIFVNDVAIRRKISDEIASLFTVYKSSSQAIEEKFITIDGAGDQDQAAAVVTGDKNTTLVKILSVALEAFLYDEKHGLDKNLSVEIRHGFFANKIRSKLEERHLITEKDEAGNYALNEYWAGINALLTDEALEEIDACLRWFSHEFNSIISLAESWMKISNDHADTTRVFKYEIYLDQFEPVRDHAERSVNHEELLDKVIELLWERTETHLEAMRSRIDTDLRHQVDSLFLQLIAKLDDVRGQAPIAELMGSINRTRNDIREDISAVADWFRRDGVTSISSRTLQEIVAISIECYNRLRGNQVRPSVETEQDDIEIMLDGRQVRSFLVGLMNIYENCTRHSGFGTDTPISVTLSGSSRGWSIRVSNPVTDEVLSRLEEGGLLGARERMSGPAYSQLMRTEGGSGLRKVSTQLSESIEGAKVGIDTVLGDFVVVISHG